MAFGSRLKKLREKRGWTQQDLADHLNISRNTVAGYESKGKIPREDTLVTIAKLFNTSTDYLLGTTDDPTPKDPKDMNMKEFLDQPTFYWDEGVPAHPEGVKMFKELLEMAKAKAREELQKQREAEEKEQSRRVAEEKAEYEKRKNG